MSTVCARSDVPPEERSATETPTIATTATTTTAAKSSTSERRDRDPAMRLS